MGFLASLTRHRLGIVYAEVAKAAHRIFRTGSRADWLEMMTQVLSWSGAIFAMLVEAAIIALIATNGKTRGGFETVYAWGLFGVAILWALTYAMARAKNRPSIGWLASTIVLGPLVPLLLLFQPRRAYNEGSTRLCANCLKEIALNDPVCRHCAREIAVAPTPHHLFERRQSPRGLQ